MDGLRDDFSAILKEERRIKRVMERDDQERCI